MIFQSAGQIASHRSDPVGESVCLEGLEGAINSHRVQTLAGFREPIARGVWRKWAPGPLRSMHHQPDRAIAEGGEFAVLPCFVCLRLHRSLFSYAPAGVLLGGADD